jgi:hypothetical protein
MPCNFSQKVFRKAIIRNLLLKAGNKKVTIVPFAVNVTESLIPSPVSEAEYCFKHSANKKNYFCMEQCESENRNKILRNCGTKQSE